MIDDSGCRDLFIYVAGASSKTAAPGIVIGMRNTAGGSMEWHVLYAADLEALVKANPAVTFKFLFDAPYSGRVTPPLLDEPNVVLVMASGGPNDGSFTYLPELLGPNGLVANSANPDQLLEFTNAILAGVQAWIHDQGEVDWAMQQRAAGNVPSMMAWMFARGLGLTPGAMLAAPLELLKLPNATPPGPPQPRRRRPEPGRAQPRAEPDHADPDRRRRTSRSRSR